MTVQLIRHKEQYFLLFDNRITQDIGTRGTRDFLRNYSNPNYLIEIEKGATPKADDFVKYELLAYADDQHQLCICAPELMQLVFLPEFFSYITVEEFAEKYNRKKAIVLRFCKDGRIGGAIQVGSVWLIPEDAPYPADARVGARVPSSRITKL